MTLTTMQYALMNRIAHDEYTATNGGTPTQASDVNVWLFADDWAKDLQLTGKQVGGLLTTLAEAGMIVLNKVKKTKGQPDESSVWFTDAGFAAWEASHIAEAAIADLKQEETPAEPVAAPTKGKPGPAGEYADDRKLHSWVANPKKVGSASHARYGMYAGAKTVGEFLAAGGTRADLRWELAHGHVLMVAQD